MGPDRPPLSPRIPTAIRSITTMRDCKGVGTFADRAEGGGAKPQTHAGRALLIAGMARLAAVLRHQPQPGSSNEPAGHIPIRVPQA